MIVKCIWCPALIAIVEKEESVICDVIKLHLNQYLFRYNKVTGCISVCVFVPKDLANR